MTEKQAGNCTMLVAFNYYKHYPGPAILSGSVSIVMSARVQNDLCAVFFVAILPRLASSPSVHHRGLFT